MRCGFAARAIPDVDRITVCMIKNKSQLSPGCRVFFRPDPEAAVTPVASRQADQHQAGIFAKAGQRQTAQGQKAGKAGCELTGGCTSARPR